MNRLVLVSFVALLLLYSGGLIFNRNQAGGDIENPAYQQYIREFEQLTKERVQKYIDENNLETSYNITYGPGSADGTVSNFEGPQVHLKGIKFWHELMAGEDDRVTHFDGISAIFDPDHPYFGMPDVQINIQDVRLFNPAKGAISKYLGIGFGDTSKPYRIYKKRISGDSVGVADKYMLIQLWLTEFHVTVSIKPDRESPVRISDEEKNNLSYPGYYYGSRLAKHIRLKDIKKEHKDQRYGNLSFILEIIPDNTPAYIETRDGASNRADFAIAAVYCNSIDPQSEPSYQRIKSNIFSGQPLFLNNSVIYDTMNTNVNKFSGFVDSDAEKLMKLNALKDEFIWNKPYYLKLHFENIGSWRDGVFNQNQYHDQITYQFLMPIFVVGSWDIISPQEVLPEWKPPDPYERKFTLRNLLPFWNMGLGGKIGSTLLIGLIIVTGISVLFPGLFKIFRKLIGL